MQMFNWICNFITRCHKVEKTETPREFHNQAQSRDASQPASQPITHPKRVKEKSRSNETFVKSRQHFVFIRLHFIFTTATALFASCLQQWNNVSQVRKLLQYDSVSLSRAMSQVPLARSIVLPGQALNWWPRTWFHSLESFNQISMAESLSYQHAQKHD